MNTRPITKAEAIAAFGGRQSELARALGITRQSVFQFADGPLPELYDLKLKFVVFPQRGLKWEPLDRAIDQSSNTDRSAAACESEISDLSGAA